MRKSQRKALVEALLQWYRRHRRDLPWRRTRDPYRIWVSEIMLQQTRVATVIPYYERFLSRFPNVESLARVGEQELLESWSGLGYYRRARQMQAAARRIVEEYGGRFPDTFEGLLELPGIGPYTAAAIASISFGRRHAVVDGNVLRVVTRWLDDDGDIRRSDVKSRIQQRAQEILESGAPRRAALFNQAVMELGATLCRPRRPQCLLCPVARHCRARRRGVEELRPVKSKTDRSQRLEVAVAVVRRGASLLMRQRPAASSLMPGFWELPQASGKLLDGHCFQELGITLGDRLGEFRHGITFRDLRGSVYRGRINGGVPPDYLWISLRRLKALPLTTITRKALALFEMSRQGKPGV